MSPVYIKTRVGKTGKRYLVYYRRGGRSFPEEYAGSFKTQKEATERRNLIASELANGRNPQLILEAIKTPPPPAAGLEQRWNEFSASRIDVRAKAQAQYRNARDRWLPILGRDRDPATVTPTDIMAGIGELLEELAASTVRQYVSNLSMVFDFCEIEPNPTKSPKVRLPAIARVEREIPSTAAWHALRDKTKKRSRLALRLMEACAFRVSETATLEWGDIDFIEGMARIRRDNAKTKSSRRWVPVPDELLDDIADLMPVEDRSVHRKVLGIKSTIVYQDMAAACVAAGVTEYGTHVLRHRRVSLWLRHGIDAVQVARWAGHARSSISLDVYGHVVNPGEDEWADFWKAAYAAARTPGAARVRHETDES